MTSNDGTGLAAFGLVSRSEGSLEHASRPNGSFMILDGRLLKPTDSLEDLLDEWLTSGTQAFDKYVFHGFIAAWNVDTSDCVLVRDPFGMVPGYTAESEHGVVFSTDVATLARFGADSTPNAEAIDIFLATGSFPAPLTPISSVSKVPPGFLVTITDNGLGKPEPWFHRDTHDQVAEADALELIRDSFHQSLERTWPANGDAGLLLSSGVDSTMILIGVTRMLDAPIRAFTFRYDDYEGELNEGGRARAVADHLGVHHEEIVIRPEDVLADLEGAVAAYDEPFTWGLHSYKLGPLAEQGITSVFSGLGSDVWNLTKRHRAAFRFNQLPGPMRHLARATIRAARPLGLKDQGRAEWASQSVSGVGELYSSDSPLNRQTRRRLYRDPTLVDRSGQKLINIYQDAADQHASDDTKGALVYLVERFNGAESVFHWNRSWTLAYGLDLLVPYFDNDLVDLAMNLEGKSTGKDYFRQLAAQHLPDDLAQTPRIPQQIPVSDWLRGPLAGPVRERLADMPSSMATIFDPDSVTQVMDEHVQGSADNGWRLIALLTTAAWFDQLPY
jgi:asparagine synthase (glutamine-hydrolysing)